MTKSQKAFAIAWLVLAAAMLWGSGTPVMSGVDPLAFPAQLNGWTHSMSLEKGSVELYVNPEGLQSKATNKDEFPDGAKLLLIFNDANGRPTKYRLMAKDDQLFPATGGWGFAAFNADGLPQRLNSEKDCWSCHASPSVFDHVFTASPR